MEYDDFDDILTDLKTGRWNLYHIFTYSITLFLIPQLLIGGVFLAPNTKVICDLPKFLENSTSVVANECSYTYNISVNATLFQNSTEDTEKEYKCNRWIYDEVPGNTLTSEFDLVCDRSYLRPSYMSSMMIGSMIGGPVNGYISDRLGRRQLHIFGLTMVMLLTLASSFASSYSFILATRWLIGLLSPTATHTGYVLCMELLEPKLRPSVVLLLSVPWAVGMTWVGALAYFVRDWRWLIRATLLPCLINWPLVWFMDESARWLIVRGSLNKAQKILEKAFRQNKTALPEGNQLRNGINEIYQRSMKEEAGSNPDMSCGDKFKRLLKKLTLLFRTPETRRRTLLMYFMHFSGSMVYYGLTLNSVNFHLNPYVYIIVAGATEIPSYIISPPIVAKFGRIKPVIVFQTIVGVSILILAFAHIELEWISICLSLLGKFTVSSAINIAFLQDSELLPTEVKVQIYGTCISMSRLGGIVAAYVTDLAGAALPWLPSALFGSICLCSAVVAWFIPETLNQHIYNTVLQLEEDTLRKKNREPSFRKKENIPLSSVLEDTD